MSESDVTRESVQSRIPGRGALTGAKGGRRGERPVVPDATFTSYYGKPILNAPVWSSSDIAGYLFLGGLAGASSGLGLMADVTRRRGVSKVSKTTATTAVSLSAAALIHDLGRPGRFFNMLRVFKVTSPMSVGSWLLAGYGPATAASAVTAWTGLLPRIGKVATASAAVLGPAVATYTAALITNTAVPCWHDGYREMPFLFAGSSAAAAGGMAALIGPGSESGLPRRLAIAGAALELGASHHMESRLGMVAEPYSEGSSGRMMKASKLLLAAGAAALAGGRRSRVSRRAGGAMMVAGSALSRFGIFAAGMASADDPKYTVQPQRERLEKQALADHQASESPPPAAN
jgi:polysulfide reductase-like protein